jgi:hypothetical protein
METMKNFSDWIQEPARARSLEVDYGVHWRRAGSRTSWRLSWIKNTGEMYAVNLWSKDYAVLAVLRGREAAEGAMAGWAQLCGSDGSLDAIAARLQVSGG